MLFNWRFVMRNFYILFGIFCAFTAHSALAETKPVLQHVPDAQKVGAGRLSFLFWNVYDATLYAPEKRYDAVQPYALKLAYLLELKGADIAERSVEEMRKQGFKDESKLSEWQKAMEKLFPDVKEGSVLTGIRDAKGDALFYLDEVFIGSIKDKAFTERFFAIWLDKNTSEPALRKQLLGLD
jgi:hypothetical protein